MSCAHQKTRIPDRRPVPNLLRHEILPAFKTVLVVSPHPCQGLVLTCLRRCTLRLSSVSPNRVMVLTTQQQTRIHGCINRLHSGSRDQAFRLMITCPSRGDPGQFWDRTVRVDIIHRQATRTLQEYCENPLLSRCLAFDQCTYRVFSV